MSGSNGDAPRELTYNDCLRYRPIDGSIGHTCIIDMSAYDRLDPGVKEMVRIQDAVATMLFKNSNRFLKQFLSAGTRTFRFIKNASPPGTKLIIWRKGSRVLVGTFRRIPGRLFKWYNLVYCDIHFNGTWEAVDAWSGPRTLDLKGAWAKSFMEMTDDVERRRLNSAGAMAEYIISNRCWIGDSMVSVSLTPDRLPAFQGGVE